jgi:tetratricopeptide (TPR) repeat protein
MAKPPSDRLFQLIHALTPAEKRYFRIYVRGKTERDSKYLQLFEFIVAMEQFDDIVLQQKIYQGNPPEGTKYSELKAYLYELILKCLQSFDELQSVDFRLNQLLQSVAVLYKRGFYDDCKVQLSKAAKIARHYESFSLQIEIIRWQKQLAYTRMDVDFLHKQLEKLHFEEDRAFQQLQNANFYRKTFFQVYAVIKQEAQHRGEDQLARMKSLVNQAHFSSPDMAMSHKARVLYYRTLNLYHYAAQEYVEFYETGQKLIHLLDSQPHFLRENLSDYIAGLSNMILACGLMRKYEEVRLYLQKMLDVAPITEDDRRKKHRQYFSGVFALYTFTGEFEEARREMLRCQEEAQQFNPLDYETAGFLGQYCYICFGCDDFDAALDYLNAWFNHSRTVEREDLQSLARILSLIIHFEMGNIVLLESLLRSTTRFMRKKNRLYDLERRIIQFMTELMRLPSGKTQPTAFLKMKADMQNEALLPAVKALLQVFDLESWLQSKIEGKKFATVVKAKFEREQA